MNTENTGPLDALIQEKLDADTEFLSGLDGMEDAEKETALADRKRELSNEAFAELQATAEKKGELADNYKVRAEKAEKGKKGEEAAPTKESQSDLTSKDILAISRADVHEDDLDELVRIAKVQNVSVAEALNDPITKAVFEQREEQRKVAKATNVKGARQGVKKVSDQELLNKANEGTVPEPGSDEAERLFRLRRGLE